MAHIEPILFFKWVKTIHPEYFRDSRVLDVGSLDINGSNKFLFYNCDYIGVDLAEGDNVDVICKAHEYDGQPFDTVISSECFEHDMYLEKTLENIVRLLKPGGLFTFSCASRKRPEHGTVEHHPGGSPFTSQIPEWCHYYKGLHEEDVRELMDVDGIFQHHIFKLHDTEGKIRVNDLYFYGIKN